MEDDLDPVKFKALVGAKWRGQHFHLLCDAVRGTEDILLIIGTHLFSNGIIFGDGINQIDYHCPLDSLRRVEEEEYRYLCTVLVDLDAVELGAE